MVTHSEYLKNDFADGASRLHAALPSTRAPIGLITLKGGTLTPLAQLLIDHVRAAAEAIALAGEPSPGWREETPRMLRSIRATLAAITAAGRS